MLFTFYLNYKMFSFWTFLSVLVITNASLWPKGVVHYAINKKDYDLHSQDEIISTFAQLHKEICVKFFNTPVNYTANERDKILYINNPEKRKDCPPEHYDFSGSVVDMPIGYKCINQKDIARIVADMLRASIEQTVSAINSYDLIKKFRAQNEDPTRSTLLSPSDRNYINAHYHNECGALSLRALVKTRRFDALTDLEPLTLENLQYYKDKLWPLGIVMYGVEQKLRDSPDHARLKYAMTSIELKTCIVFQELNSANDDAVLNPKNLLWFAGEGEELPQMGFKQGNQTINLLTMTNGVAGHSAHTVNNLLRALGLHMVSNRYDRDNYVTINWRNVDKGKEMLLEKAPAEAWITSIPYDFDSATHAPANFACGDACKLGAQTVQPVQDHLWQRSLSMGHRTELSEFDIKLLNILYGKQCQNRFMDQ